MEDWDIEELACILCGMDYDEVCNAGDEWDAVNNALYERYSVDFETFAKIAKDLVGYTPVIKTALTETLVQGFVMREKGDLWRFIVKRKYELPQTEKGLS